MSLNKLVKMRSVENFKLLKSTSISSVVRPRSMAPDFSHNKRPVYETVVSDEDSFIHCAMVFLFFFHYLPFLLCFLKLKECVNKVAPSSTK